MFPQIRPAATTDAPAIAAIYSHYVLTSTATFELDPPDVSEIARRIAEITARGLPYLVAEVEGAVAGYAYVGMFRPRPGYRFTVEDTVYLEPGFTGRGLGRRLLGELISVSRAAGCRQMVGGVGGENPASVAMHRALGFEHVGVLRKVGFKFERWLDLTLMQREL